MTPERWRQIREVFDAACALPADERGAFLTGLCDGDNELRREVESLLAASAADPEFLETPAVLSGLDLPEEPSPRERIGPYRVVGELGHGGMGTVYAGVHEQGGFTRRVALKVIRRGMDSDLILHRFLTERQILASLEHPLIARLYDAGTTEDGLPYFVMEQIDGRSLVADCDARCLPVAARIELFRQVCAAVQYAHQRLIVHRDLKPSNILVTADGVPKLLDFGLATVLDPEIAAADVTIAGARLMTPDYASPEQVRGDRVTTATDVYSLGAVLHELLTGRPPRAGEPERPSAAVLTAPEEVSRARGTTAHRLQRQLAGDLDNIVLKALRQEPERRYGSAEQLAEDLHRHLAGLPVSARPDTLWYRTRKLAQRHRAGLAAAAAVILAVALLTVFYTVRLARERDHARREAETARQVSVFLASLFELSDPERAKGAKLTARDLLDRGARSIDHDLAGQPAVAAAMLDLIGNVYRDLNLYPQAKPLLERSLALRTRTLGAESAETAESRRDLGTLLHSMGDDKSARALLEQALRTQERVLGPSHPEVAKTATTLANVLKATGDYSRARALFERAIAIQQAAPGGATLDATKTLSNYGLLLQRLGDPQGAKALFERALALQEKLLGPQSPTVASTLNNLASTERQLDDLSDAIRLEERALVICEAAYGRDHRVYAAMLGELGNMMNARGDRAHALELLRSSVEAYEKALGPDHPDTANAVRNLAILYAEGGDHATALGLFLRVLSIRERARGPEDPFVAQSLEDVAQERLHLDPAAPVEPLLRRALAICRGKLPPAIWTPAACSSFWAAFSASTTRRPRASPCSRRAPRSSAAPCRREAPTSGTPNPGCAPAPAHDEVS
ncbi:MAG TPA: serine/threonine-protein kinase [Thermoanaerobaculia bacterium]|jgi:serine/threonine-protein kinase|nr:serine/threonine-protein kinase [Thermoanaerobaculia bacterium]